MLLEQPHATRLEAPRPVAAQNPGRPHATMLADLRLALLELLELVVAPLGVPQ
ncbi:MAG: hypothetical protein Fur005_04740 [Roseiflexaceae bacterium]